MLFFIGQRMDAKSVSPLAGEKNMNEEQRAAHHAAMAADIIAEQDKMTAEEKEALRDAEVDVRIAFEGRARSYEAVQRFSSMGDQRGIALAREDEARYGGMLAEAERRVRRYGACR